VNIQNQGKYKPKYALDNEKLSLKMSEDEAGDKSLSSAQCQNAIDEFVSVTKTDEALAMFFLQDHNWLVGPALEAYFAQHSGEQSRIGDATNPESLVSVL